MNTKHVLVLAAVAVVAIGATALSRQSSPGRITADNRGASVFPDLLKQANSIASINVKDANGAITIVRNDKGFFEKESGYPVKSDTFRELVAAAATFSFEEAKTSDASRFRDLGLDTPAGKKDEPKKPGDKKKADKDKKPADAGKKPGREVTFFNADGKSIASFIAGSSESNVGGARGGQYIRLPNFKHAWLIRGSANIPSPHTAWFEINLINLNKKVLSKVELTGGGLETINLESADEKADLKIKNPIPEGKKENSTNVLRVAFMVDPISFEQVRKAKGEAKPDARKAIITSRDGLKITITNVGDIKDSWVRISTESTDDKAKKKAEELKKKIDGFEFKMIGRYAEVLGWKLDNFLEAEKAKK